MKILNAEEYDAFTKECISRVEAITALVTEKWPTDSIVNTNALLMAGVCGVIVAGAPLGPTVRLVLDTYDAVKDVEQAEVHREIMAYFGRLMESAKTVRGRKVDINDGKSKTRES